MVAGTVRWRWAPEGAAESSAEWSQACPIEDAIAGLERRREKCPGEQLRAVSLLLRAAAGGEEEYLLEHTEAALGFLRAHLARGADDDTATFAPGDLGVMHTTATVKAEKDYFRYDRRSQICDDLLEGPFEDFDIEANVYATAYLIFRNASPDMYSMWPWRNPQIRIVWRYLFFIVFSQLFAILVLTKWLPPSMSSTTLYVDCYNATTLQSLVEMGVLGSASASDCEQVGTYAFAADVQGQTVQYNTIIQNTAFYQNVLTDDDVIINILRVICCSWMFSQNYLTHFRAIQVLLQYHDFSRWFLPIKGAEVRNSWVIIIPVMQFAVLLVVTTVSCTVMCAQTLALDMILNSVAYTCIAEVAGYFNDPLVNTMARTKIEPPPYTGTEIFYLYPRYEESNNHDDAGNYLDASWYICEDETGKAGLLTDYRVRHNPEKYTLYTKPLMWVLKVALIAVPLSVVVVLALHSNDMLSLPIAAWLMGAIALAFLLAVAATVPRTCTWTPAPPGEPEADAETGEVKGSETQPLEAHNMGEPKGDARHVQAGTPRSTRFGRNGSETSTLSSRSNCTGSGRTPSSTSCGSKPLGPAAGHERPHEAPPALQEARPEKPPKAPKANGAHAASERAPAKRSAEKKAATRSPRPKSEEEPAAGRNPFIEAHQIRSRGFAIVDFNTGAVTLPRLSGLEWVQALVEEEPGPGPGPGGPASEPSPADQALKDLAELASLIGAVLRVEGRAAPARRQGTGVQRVMQRLRCHGVSATALEVTETTTAEKEGIFFDFQLCEVKASQRQGPLDAEAHEAATTLSAEVLPTLTAVREGGRVEVDLNSGQVRLRRELAFGGFGSDGQPEFSEDSRRALLDLGRLVEALQVPLLVEGLAPHHSGGDAADAAALDVEPEHVVQHLRQGARRPHLIRTSGTAGGKETSLTFRLDVLGVFASTKPRAVRGWKASPPDADHPVG